MADLWDRLSPRNPRGADAVTWLTLYVVLLLGIPSRLVVGPLGSAGAVSMLVGLCSCGLWLLFWVGVPWPGPMRSRPLRVALAVFLFCVGISYVLAMAHPINRDEVSPADVVILSLLSWSGTLLLAHDGIPSRERLETFVWRLALGGGALALLGIAQFVLRQSFADRISIPGLTAIAGTGIGYRNGLVRPAGTATSPIEFGALLSILLPLALHVGFHHQQRALLLRWAPAFSIGAVVAVSSSRTAYLGAVIGVAACMIAWTRRQRSVVLILGVVGLAVVSMLMPRLLKSITSMFTGAEEDPSIESRTGSYDTAWAFLSHHPFFGRGLGTFLPKYRIFDNEYLQLLVCVGIVGTIAFVGLLVAAIYQLTRLFRHSADAGAKDLAVALVGATVAGFASLAFFDAFAFPMTMGTLFLVLGVAGAAGRLAVARPDGSSGEQWEGSTPADRTAHARPASHLAGR